MPNYEEIDNGFFGFETRYFDKNDSEKFDLVEVLAKSTLKGYEFCQHGMETTSIWNSEFKSSWKLNSLRPVECFGNVIHLNNKELNYQQFL